MAVSGRAEIFALPGYISNRGRPNRANLDSIVFCHTKPSRSFGSPCQPVSRSLCWNRVARACFAMNCGDSFRTTVLPTV
jgi:hypothetical protein